MAWYSLGNADSDVIDTVTVDMIHTAGTRGRPLMAFLMESRKLGVHLGLSSQHHPMAVVLICSEGQPWRDCTV